MADASSFAPVLDAAARGRLVVFAGAGISVEAPSCLPDWSGFNRLLLDTIKTSALRSIQAPTSKANPNSPFRANSAMLGIVELRTFDLCVAFLMAIAVFI